MSARRQNRQPRSHGASHVEQREAVDYRVELIQTVDLRKAPGGVDLIAVRQADKLRASGRAAGMEERAYGVAVRRKPEVQGGALRQQALIEADDLTARIAFAADDQNPLKRRHAVDDRVGLLQSSASSASEGMTSTVACSVIRRSAIAFALSRKLIVPATPATCAPMRAGGIRGSAGQRKATAPLTCDMPSDRKRLAERVISSSNPLCDNVTALSSGSPAGMTVSAGRSGWSCAVPSKSW